MQTFEERNFVTDWKMQRVLNNICPFCEETTARIIEDFTPNHNKVELDCGTWWLFNRANPSETVLNQSSICKRVESLERENEKMREDLSNYR